MNAPLRSIQNLRTKTDNLPNANNSNRSTKFAPWLALGCVSPRRIYSECKRYEAERVENKSTYWVVFELIWRDFFRFMSLEVG